MYKTFLVVSYRNSTSNHNSAEEYLLPLGLYLIEILHQTTTAASWCRACCRLYLIEILHQTTTIFDCVACYLVLYLIEILHQTTTDLQNAPRDASLYLIEILHQTTTQAAIHVLITRCILSKFYIKPQLVSILVIELLVVSYRNSTSNHNSRLHQRWAVRVVSYRNSTSNHNISHCRAMSQGLYLIEILHQTTTTPVIETAELLLYLIEILHQTTT